MPRLVWFDGWKPKDTVTQLFNLVGSAVGLDSFEVYAFSNQYTKYNDVKFEREAGAFNLDSFCNVELLFFKNVLLMKENEK